MSQPAKSVRQNDRSLLQRRALEQNWKLTLNLLTVEIRMQHDAITHLYRTGTLRATVSSFWAAARPASRTKSARRSKVLPILKSQHRLQETLSGIKINNPKIVNRQS